MFSALVFTRYGKPESGHFLKKIRAAPTFCEQTLGMTLGQNLHLSKGLHIWTEGYYSSIITLLVCSCEIHRTKFAPVYQPNPVCAILI